MAHTALPADRLKAACEKSAAQIVVDTDHRRAVILSLLHLSSAALSVDASAKITVTAEEFMVLAANW